MDTPIGITKFEIKQYLNIVDTTKQEYEDELSRLKNDLRYAKRQKVHYETEFETSEDVLNQYKTFMRFPFKKDCVPYRVLYDAALQAESNYMYHSSEIQYYDQRIDYYEKRIEATQKAYDTYLANLNEEKEVEDEGVKKLLEQIRTIHNFSFIEDIYYNDGALTFKTNRLIMTEPITGKRFLLGNAYIKFYNCRSIVDNIRISTNNVRIAYEQSDMYHPHVFMSGKPCWGNAYNDLVLEAERNDYISMILTIVQFLQTADITDEAGRFIAAWDEVDDNDIIEKSGEPGFVLYDNGDVGEPDAERCECAVCGFRGYLDEMNYCYDCESYVCDDCNNYIETYDHDHMNICNDCIDEWTKCPKCGLYVRNDETREFDGEDYCPYCYEELVNEEEEF